MISLLDIAGMLLTLVVYGAYIFLIAFTLWMAVDAGKQDRFWWMVLIIGIPFVGSGVYFFTEKKHEYAKAESHHVHDTETETQHETSHEKHKRKPRRQKVDTSNEKKEEEILLATETSETPKHTGDTENTSEGINEAPLVQEEKKETEKGEEGATS